MSFFDINQLNTSQRVKKQIDKFVMTLDLSSDGISKPLYYQGGREKCFMSILYSEINEGYSCIDLGSNIGYTTLYMAEKAGTSGKIYAIEPDPWNFDLLVENLEQNNFLNRNTEVFHAAISDSSGEIEFWQSDKSNLSSVQKTKHSNKCIKVKAYSLNDFLSDKRYPNFIKMDVEGHEVKIFEGGLDYFSKHHEGVTKFLVEVHPQFYDKDNDFEKILKEYFKLGFTNKYVVSTPIPQPQKFAEAGYTPIASVNTDGFFRGIYGHISDDHLLDFACRENIEGNSKKIVRSFLLERQ